MRRIPLLLPALVALVLASPHAAQRRGEDAAARVGALLAEVRDPGQSARAARELARLGRGAVEPLFQRLCAGDASVPSRAAVLGAFALLPREDVIAHVRRLADRPDDASCRTVALDLLGRLGSTSELALAIELGSPEPSAPCDPVTRAALESALAGIASREPGAARALTELFSRSPAAAQPSIAVVLARQGGDGAVAGLAGLLGARKELDAMLLLLIHDRARHQAPETDLLALERVRGYLGHPDARLAALAASASRALGDYGAVPDLIVLLDDGRANIRRSAHDALVELTGLRLPANAEPWLAWLDESLAWWDERADACRVAFVSGPAADAAAALEEVGRQRLHLDDVASLLVLVTARPEADLVARACRVLAALPVRAARAALLALASTPDHALAEQARLALQGLERAKRAAPRRATASLPSLSRIP